MKKKGFTLIELMIVVAIIAILAAAALPAFGEQIRKARDGKAVQMMGNMRSVVSMAQADLEGYAPDEDHIPEMFTDEGLSGVRGVDDQPDFSVTVRGIQGYNKITTAADATTLKAGTPAAGIGWSYSADDAGVTWTLLFDEEKDTKGKDWSEY